jgi:hypothetical protein
MGAPLMAMTATERSRVLRERRASGKIVRNSWLPRLKIPQPRNRHQLSPGPHCRPSPGPGCSWYRAEYPPYTGYEGSTFGSYTDFAQSRPAAVVLLRRGG